MIRHIFLIRPVRGCTPEMQSIVESIKGTEPEFSVYDPATDTAQDDPTGYRICQDNELAIRMADEVWFVWDGKSQGCLFDLGMAWAIGKPLKVMYCPPPTTGKSFQNMAREWNLRSEEL